MRERVAYKLLSDSQDYFYLRDDHVAKESSEYGLQKRAKQACLKWSKLKELLLQCLSVEQLEQLCRQLSAVLLLGNLSFETGVGRVEVQDLQVAACA